MAPETRRNMLCRHPFSNLTNSSSAAAAAPQSITKYTPKKTITKTKPRPARSSSNSVGSSSDPMNPPPSTPLRSDNVIGTLNFCISIQHVAIAEVTEGGRKDKRKTVVAASACSCPPLDKTKNIRLASDSKDDEIPLARLFSEPSKKSNKRLQHCSSKKERDIQKQQLQQDYIDKQRAYFKEVDDFELPVEEVSSSELE